MKKIQLILAAVALLSLPSCRFIKVNSALLDGTSEGKKVIVASDTMATKDTTVGEFNSIGSYIACNVVYTTGESSVSLSGPDNVLKYIVIENKDGKLSVSKDSKISFNKLQKVTLKVSCPELKEVNFNGAVEFSAPTGISAPDFKVEVNGAADIDIDGLKTGSATIYTNGSADIDIDGLDCSELSMEVNGAGDIVITGRAGKAKAEINGAGDIDASGLDCKDFSAQTHGLGKIKRPR